MQNDTPITTKWSRSKPEVVISYLSRQLTKFGLLVDFDLLKAVTSTNTKPEVVFSVRGRHLEKWI